MQPIHIVLFSCGALLLGWAVARWRKSEASDPERIARRDTVVLIVLLQAAVLGDWLRTLFPERSPGFLVTSLALVVIGIAALAITARLAGAYRRSAAAVAGRKGAGSGAGRRRE